jgi:hypothetical protein
MQPGLEQRRGGATRILRSKKRMIWVVAALAPVVLASLALAGIWTQDVPIDGNNTRLRVVHTIAGDFDSGWHTHPGLAIVQVQRGTMQITQQGCTAKSVAAGETLVEVPLVPVRAVAVGTVEWTTTFVIQYGVPPTTLLTTNPCP